MPIIENNKKCVGCKACKDICVFNAIEFIENEKGFLYPRINKNNCMNCGKCQEVCPIGYDSFIPYEKIKAFIGIHKEQIVLDSSSSGGAFFALCQIYIKDGYEIYGVVLDDDFRVKYKKASKIEDCKQFSKSKYIQADTDDIVFEQVATGLSNGKKILFSGTSCYCAALIQYLKYKNINITNLITVNILCRGVPNQKLFDMYISEQEKIYKRKINEYIFRYKGCYDDTMKRSKIVFDDNTYVIKNEKDDPYLKGYNNKLFYRDSCYECEYTKKERITDYTISDAKKLDKYYKEFDASNGVSMILFNTEKAKNKIDSISKYLLLKEIKTDDAFSSQNRFYRSSTINKKTKNFYENLNKIGFTKAVEKAINKTFINRLKLIIINYKSI